MILLCSEPIILSHIPYGKNKGKKFVDVARTDRQDLHYLQNANWPDEDMKPPYSTPLKAPRERHPNHQLWQIRRQNARGSFRGES